MGHNCVLFSLKVVSASICLFHPLFRPLIYPMLLNQSNVLPLLLQPSAARTARVWSESKVGERETETVCGVASSVTTGYSCTLDTSSSLHLTFTAVPTLQLSSSRKQENTPDTVRTGNTAGTGKSAKTVSLADNTVGNQTHQVQ